MADAALTVYLAGPVTGDAERDEKLFRPALDALTDAGYTVTAPAWQSPRAVTVDALLGDVEICLGVLAHADWVVTLPGSEVIFEPVIAASLGVPVVPLDEFLPAAPVFAA